MENIDVLKKKCLDKVSFLLEKPLSPADVKDVAEAIKVLNEVATMPEKKISKKQID